MLKPVACRRFIYPCGSVIGTTEFFSHRVRIFHSVAGDQGCRLLTISREGFNSLQEQHPQARFTCSVSKWHVSLQHPADCMWQAASLNAVSPVMPVQRKHIMQDRGVPCKQACMHASDLAACEPCPPSHSSVPAQAALALLTIVVRTSILDATQVWEYLERSSE